MKKRFTDEQIVNKLRLAEKLRDEGHSIAVIVKQLGVTQQTYYRWKRKYMGMDTPEVKRLRSLEEENSKLKKLLAEAQLDNLALKEVIEGNF